MFYVWLIKSHISAVNVRNGREYADLGQVQPEISHFDDAHEDRRVYVTGMKLWIRRWDGRPVLGGKIHTQ